MTDAGVFDDLSELLPLQRLVNSLDPSGPPEARIVATPTPSGPRRDSATTRCVGVLPGSFNPLHDAHVSLARRGGEAARLDAVFYCLSKRTVDKERIVGLGLTDRLYLLRRHCASEENRGVLFVNRGLYVDQARIAYAAFPSLRELWFLVGYDKMVQIFDPRYYADRDAALSELFGMARFLVAPRGDNAHDDLRRLLDEPANRRFADRVEPLDLPVVLRDVSSSDVRQAVVQGKLDALPIPAVVHDFIRYTGAYAPPVELSTGETVDRAMLRSQLIDALATNRPWLPSCRDLTTLVQLAMTDGPDGRALRRQLASDEARH